MKIIYCLVLSITIFSCNAKNEIAKNDEHERKETFLKILKFIKENKIDSVRRYCMNQYEDDSTYFLNAMNLGYKYANHSPDVQLIDSVIKVDSSYYQNPGVWSYEYCMKFKLDNNEVGNIYMTFFSNNNEKIVNIYADKDGAGELDFSDIIK